jgi:hypothetical protein
MHTGEKGDDIVIQLNLRREVVVHFVDIGGIVDHQCLNYLQ